MYCSTCGVAVTQGLGYCKHCGAKLSGPTGDAVVESAGVKSETLVSAMAAVFILGLMTITVLMGVMKAVLGFNVGQIFAFAMLSFLTMLLLEGVFIRLLFRKRGSKEAEAAVELKGHATKELDAAPQRVLPEPLPSVTEHTTRAFEPIYNERTPK